MGSATVPVALSGVSPGRTSDEDASGEDAERGGRNARAPPGNKFHLTGSKGKMRARISLVGARVWPFAPERNPVQSACL